MTYGALAESEARAYVLATQHRLYDVGDKALKLLAWLERRDRDRSWVVGVRDGEGALKTTSNEIAEAFAAHFERVYAPVCTRSESDCAEFLRDLDLPTVPLEARDRLEADITVEELGKALGALKIGEGIGPQWAAGRDI